MDPDADLKRKYHLHLAAAFVLGSVENLTLEKLVRMGQAAGLKMQRFKKVPVLPRVARVIEILKGLHPVDLLDIGSGRGTSLIQILVEFPNLCITAVENDPKLLPDLHALGLGLRRVDLDGEIRLSHLKMDATNMDLHAQSWDVVTALEVLEHIQDTQKAVCELVRVCRRCVVFSVPSEPDTNPDHIHLHTREDLERMFTEAGAVRVVFDAVPGHTVGIAWKAG